MKGEVSGTPSRRTRSKLSAFASPGADTKLIPNRREQSPEGGDRRGDLAQEAVQPQKKLDDAPRFDPLSLTEAHFTRTSAQPPAVAGEEAGNLGKALSTFAHTSHRLIDERWKTTLQPQPGPPKRPYASSLEPQVESRIERLEQARLQKRQIDSNGNVEKKGSKASAAPRNLEDIRERLDRPRGTASPPESAYEDYFYQAKVAPNESTMAATCYRC
ncbi:hypothetical protein B0T22DRAFT_517256 [Podospora appendiculata]|uniref:Uncharacterized protein n=1 Tax=Podospora appendiculata TaxID=314037 RepID=A0AAE1CA87_9PEZI|nr:hypothetical protein B0T22DRAFT_517256 [Podospora appendiculata]